MLEVVTEHSVYCVDTRNRLMWRHPREQVASKMSYDHLAVYVVACRQLKVGRPFVADVRYPDGRLGHRVSTDVLSIKSNIHQALAGDPRVVRDSEGSAWPGL